MKKIQGIGVGGGLVIGTAFVYRPTSAKVVTRTNVDVTKERTRLDGAVEEAKKHLTSLANHLNEKGQSSESDILMAQTAFLDDVEYFDKIVEIINQKGINAEKAIQEVGEELMAEFKALDDVYFQQRATDVQDITTRLINNLSGNTTTSLSNIQSPVIIIAQDLLPSDTALLQPAMALAICTEEGTTTSHTAILAKGLSIPAVVGCGSLNIPPNQTLVVDGTTGTIIVAPPKETLAQYQKRITIQKNQHNYLLSQAHKPAITTDNTTISILANIGSNEEALLVSKNGAEGIGLLRTEGLFFETRDLPSEEQQHQTLRTITESIPNNAPCMIRALDIGGDKPLPALANSFANEKNPFLGVRGIRFLFSYPEILNAQLRAILRIKHQNTKLFFPLISDIDEVRKIKHIIKQVMAELEHKNIPYNREIEVGIMVEIPSSVTMISHILHEVDFVSIGSNDLAQYALAADRTNENIQDIANYFQPSVFILIQQVIDAGLKAHKMVELCGEMAGDIRILPILIGMGLRNLSMSTSQIPLAKEIIRSISIQKCTALAAECVSKSTSQEVRECVQKWYDRNYTNTNIDIDYSTNI